jgi:hypothetical protein
VSACVCGAPSCPGGGGGYYVSLVEGPRRGLLLGPFETHQEALGRVEDGRRRASAADPWLDFAAFGTLRVKAPPFPASAFGF